MAYLEIDRLKISDASETEAPGIDLSVDKGTICCLFSNHISHLRAIGDAVSGLGDGYEGRIFIDDESIDKYPPGQRGVAICGADIGLYEHLPAMDNLAIPLKINNLPPMEIRALIEKNLFEFGLGHAAGEYPEELNPGDRMKLSFAKAALSKPKVIIFDLIRPNPSGFTAYPIIDLLKYHAHAMGLTVLAITDNTFFALNFGDRVAYLGSTKIIQQNSPKDLINSPGHIEVARAFAFPHLNIFEGTVAEESPFLFVEDADCFFNLPARLRGYFRSRLGMRQVLAVRPERVQLIHPDEVQPRGRNIIDISRLDYLGFGIFAHFEFGGRHWCAFLPSDRVVYSGMQMGVFVPEEEWYIVDDDGNILLDL